MSREFEPTPRGFATILQAFGEMSRGDAAMPRVFEPMPRGDEPASWGFAMTPKIFE